MHKFLRAIGFSKIKRDELKTILTYVEKHPTTEKAAIDSEETNLWKLQKSLEISSESRSEEFIEKTISLRWNITIHTFLGKVFLPEK